MSVRPHTIHVSSRLMRVMRWLCLMLVVLVPFGGSSQAFAQHRQVLGYYVPYDPTSWASLQAHADALDFVATQWVTVDACGGLGSRDDQTLKQFAAAHGLKVLPSLLTGSASLNHSLLTDQDVSDQAVDQIVAYTLAENYAGFDLDLEAVDAADRDALTDFVGRVADGLHQQGRLLTLALPPKDRDVTVGWAGAYDYAALGAEADAITIMAYAYRGPFSGPGSVAPYDWVQRVVAFATQQIPPGKVLLGLAFYGYDWNTTSGGARSVSYSQAAALADQYATPFTFDPQAQSATFTYASAPGDRPPPSQPTPGLAHDITVREPPPCGDTPPPSPAPARPPSASTPPDEPQTHEVWIEDSASAVARVGLADRYGALGIATWRLGLEDPRVWDAIGARRPGTNARPG